MNKLLKYFFRPLNQFILKLNREEQLRRLSHIPTIPLTHKNVKNCKLLLNRSELLSSIGSAKMIAELGVDEGLFSNQLMTLNPDKLHLIDPWNSKRYGESKYQIVMENNSKKIADTTIKVHRMLSCEACELFPNNYFDLIYIDTDHTYDTTRKELESYSAKMKADGIIAGHDYIRSAYNGDKFGVVEAVNEFCVNNNWEFIFMTIDQIENPSFAIRRIKTSN